jgi:predicted metalloprotease with PDZ domain
VIAEGVDGGTQIRLAEFSMGAVTVNTPLCEVWDGGGARIGMRLLSRFEVALDRDNARLHLLPLVELPWTDPPVCGVGLAPAEWVDGLWSLFVAEDSPAQRAGILPGDLLVSVNGIEMEGQSFGFVQRSLGGKPDRLLDVAVLRGGEVLVFRLATDIAL